jgi:hypothetical protein
VLSSLADGSEFAFVSPMCQSPRQRCGAHRRSYAKDSGGADRLPQWIAAEDQRLCSVLPT